MKVERKWMPVIATEYNNAQIGEVYGNDVEVKDRVMVVYSGEIGYKNKNYKIYFRINDANQNEAFAKIDKIELLRDYISRIIRKGVTKRDVVRPVEIEGKPYYIKILVLINKTNRRMASLETHETVKFIEEFFKNKPMKQITDEVIEGKAKEELFNRLNKIYPVKEVEVRMIEKVRK